MALLPPQAPALLAPPLPLFKASALEDRFLPDQATAVPLQDFHLVVPSLPTLVIPVEATPILVGSGLPLPTLDSALARPTLDHPLASPLVDPPVSVDLQCLLALATAVETLLATSSFHLGSLPLRPLFPPASMLAALAATTLSTMAT